MERDGNVYGKIPNPTRRIGTASEKSIKDIKNKDNKLLKKNSQTALGCNWFIAIKSNSIL